jgi:hypothetical protein
MACLWKQPSRRYEVLAPSERRLSIRNDKKQHHRFQHPKQMNFEPGGTGVRPLVRDSFIYLRSVPPASLLCSRNADPWGPQQAPAIDHSLDHMHRRFLCQFERSGLVPAMTGTMKALALFLNFTQTACTFPTNQVWLSLPSRCVVHIRPRSISCMCRTPA